MTKDQSTAEKLTECAHNYKKTYKTTNKPERGESLREPAATLLQVWMVACGLHTPAGLTSAEMPVMVCEIPDDGGNSRIV